MKKLFAIVLCISMLAVLVACGGAKGLSEEVIKGQWAATLSAEDALTMSGMTIEELGLGSDEELKLDSSIEIIFDFDGAGNCTMTIPGENMNAFMNETYDIMFEHMADPEVAAELYGISADEMDEVASEMYGVDSWAEAVELMKEESKDMIEEAEDQVEEGEYEIIDETSVEIEEETFTYADGKLSGEIEGLEVVLAKK